MAKRRLATPIAVTINYRDIGTHFRVWRNHWQSDQFEIFEKADFDAFKTSALRLDFLVVEHTYDD